MSKEVTTMIKILSVSKTCAVLEENGMKISPQHLGLGLEQRVYPFGVAIRGAGGKMIYEIYSTLLEKWIAERSDST